MPAIRGKKDFIEGFKQGVSWMMARGGYDWTEEDDALIQRKAEQDWETYKAQKVQGLTQGMTPDVLARQEQ